MRTCERSVCVSLSVHAFAGVEGRAAVKCVRESASSRNQKPQGGKKVSEVWKQVGPSDACLTGRNYVAARPFHR